MLVHTYTCEFKHLYVLYVDICSYSCILFAKFFFNYFYSIIFFFFFCSFRHLSELGILLPTTLTAHCRRCCTFIIIPSICCLALNKYIDVFICDWDSELSRSLALQLLAYELELNYFIAIYIFEFILDFLFFVIISFFLSFSVFQLLLYIHSERRR